jgi:hypothetical protein
MLKTWDVAMISIQVIAYVILASGLLGLLIWAVSSAR